MFPPVARRVLCRKGAVVGEAGFCRGEFHGSVLLVWFSLTSELIIVATNQKCKYLFDCK
jgi:hypothetical protein